MSPHTILTMLICSIFYNKEILNNNTHCKDDFKNTTFGNSKRQNQTLKSILVRASFQNSELHKPTISKCGKSRCGCCNNILEQSSLFFQNADKLFEIKTNMNCSSQNRIYALICGNCKKNIHRRNWRHFKK